MSNNESGLKYMSFKDAYTYPVLDVNALWEFVKYNEDETENNPMDEHKKVLESLVKEKNNNDEVISYVDEVLELLSKSSDDRKLDMTKWELAKLMLETVFIGKEDNEKNNLGLNTSEELGYVMAYNTLLMNNIIKEAY